MSDPIDLPRLELRIRRRTAAPELCPVCGKKSDFRVVNSFGDVLYNVYSSINRVERRPVEGWPGFYDWWFVCDHEESWVKHLYRQSPLFNLIKKPETEFSGRQFRLPIKVVK